ncbi:MAG: SLC13 family permease [Thermoplasmatota archaeon]
MNWEMLLVFALVVVILFLFLREVLPIPLTALSSIVVLTGTGILTLEEGFSGFSSPATIAVLAMFVLSAGIQQTGAVAAMTERLANWAGNSHRRQIAALSLASGPISGFVNNTPVVAVLIPATIQMAQKAGINPSRLLMVVSNMAMLGGLLTIVGTSTSLLGNAVLVDLGIQPFGFFEFTVIGAIALVTGLLYYLTLGARLLPHRGDGDLVQRYDLKGFISEFQVPETSKLIGASMRDAGLSFSSGCQVLRLTRDGETLDTPSPSIPLQAGDQLLLEASRRRLAELSADLEALPDILHPLELDEESIGTAEVVITTGSRYIGRSIAQIDFRRRYQATVLAVRHQGRVEIGPISQSRLSPGDVLLVQATPKNLERMREKPDLFVTRERERATYRTQKALPAIGIVAAVVLVAALGWMDISIAALAGAIAMVIAGCVKMDEFLQSIHWDVILLLAGIIPLGAALQKTGGADLVAQWVVSAGSSLPPLGFLVLLFVIATLITEVVSNNASVVLLLPIAVASALELGVDARAAALTIILAASTSMLTPVGYQTNTMIYAPGNYRFGDYFRVGAPLGIALTIVIPLAIAWRFT